MPDTAPGRAPTPAPNPGRPAGGSRADRVLNRRSAVLAAVMLAALVVYILATAGRGIALMGLDDVVARIMGAVLLFFPLLGIWVIWAEVRFGRGASRLVRRLADEGPLPTDGLSLRPSGRPDRDAAEALVPPQKAEVERTPDDWRAWARLGLVLDAAGSRGDARRALVRAIRLERVGRS